MPIVGVFISRGVVLAILPPCEGAVLGLYACESANVCVKYMPAWPLYLCAGVLADSPPAMYMYVPMTNSVYAYSMSGDACA